MTGNPSGNPSGDVTVQVHGRAGHLSLNRPAALNALTEAMIADIAAALAAWRDDPDIAMVVLDSASPRAFCAGGDIRKVRADIRAGRRASAVAFFAAEYRLNRAIAEFPKPFVSLIDGINLGGGLGLSVNGRYQVVTERATFAMPETAIGFFPDVGASFFLNRLRSPAVGRYLGLTGHRVAGGDAVHAGLATQFIASDRLPALASALLDPGFGLGRSSADVAGILDEFCSLAPAGELADAGPLIETMFAGGIDDIVRRLSSTDGAGAQWRAATARELASGAPSRCYLTAELLDRSVDVDLATALRRELALATMVITSADFDEGVRAMLVDKDRRPRWSDPASPEHARAQLDAVDGALAKTVG